MIRNAIDAVLEIIHATGAIDYTREVAKHEAAIAVELLQKLPKSEYCNALEQLAGNSVERDY